MKNLVYLLFILLSFPTLAQQEFAPLGAKWYFQAEHAFSPSISNVSFESVKDTIISGKICKQVYKDFLSCYSGEGDYYFHQSNDSIFQYCESEDTFHLLFDFDAEIEEQWNIKSTMTFQSDINCHVDSISYLEIFPNDSLKILYVSLTDSTIIDTGNGYDTIVNPPYSEKIIERIGFEKAFFPWLKYTICDGAFEQPIHCYEDLNLGLIQFQGTSCTVGINELKKDLILLTFDIFPNPTSNSFFIKNKNTNHEQFNIQLLDFQGIQVLEKQTEIFPNQNMEVNTQHLPAGIYFLNIQHNNTSTIQKIIISR